MSLVEQTEGPLLIVRQDTLRMSQLSLLGHEVAIAKMRNTNLNLYGYLDRLHSTLPGLAAPFFNIILLEYELRSKVIPWVATETIETFEAQQTDVHVDVSKEKFSSLLTSDRQTVLLSATEAYINILNRDNPTLASGTHFAISDTYSLLRQQAIRDSS